MATLTKGQTFGASEQVTNTKLHALVDSATCTAIANADIDSAAAIADTKLATISTANKISGKALSVLATIPSAAGVIPISNMVKLGSTATNATRPSVSTLTALTLHYATYVTLTTIAGCITGQEFNIISNQASFPRIEDAGKFILNGAWVPKANSLLKLIWNGTNYIEVSRTHP